MGGERKAGVLRKIVKDEVENESLARLQYVSCADPITLIELEKEVKECLISMAVFIGKTRLIDNLRLGK